MEWKKRGQKWEVKNIFQTNMKIFWQNTIIKSYPKKSWFPAYTFLDQEAFSKILL